MITNEPRLSIPAELAGLAVACEFVIFHAENAGLDDEAIYHCRLSVEEIFTNIVEHGYVGDEPGVIDIICCTTDREFMINIIDDAPPFDPLSLPNPDPSVPLWERQGGGWGIYFVKKFMDEVEYHYQAGRNYLVMKKRLPE